MRQGAVKSKIGNKYDSWTVVGPYEYRSTPSGRMILWWYCKCDCGEEKWVISTRLIKGAHYGGCLKCRYRKHGHSVKQENGDNSGYYTYRVWWGMLNRCKPGAHRRYGGRGISVCKRWEKYENFLEDMGARPAGKDLDRKDNNKGYCKENCRWVEHVTNCRNRENNVLIEHNGESKTASEWADIHNMPRKLVAQRINKMGWSFERAVNTPSTFKRNTLTYDGKTMTIKEWSEETGLHQKCISKRIRSGWSVKDALTTPSERDKK